MLPRRYEVLDGSIVSVDAAGQPAKTDAQVDLMIADTFDFPVLLREGDTAIVLPQAVRAIVEIKTELAWTKEPSTNAFLKALRQIGALRQATDPDGAIPVTLFSYGSPASCATLRGWLDGTIAERARLRAESRRLAAAGDEPDALGLAREAARFDASLLPERIVCDTGVIALKVDDGERVVYEFYDNRLGSDVASAVVFLVDDIVQRTASQAEERHAHAFRLFQRFLGGKMLQQASESPLDMSASPAVAGSGGPQ